jgi:putative addiction module component (TIGR02574 family)
MSAAAREILEAALKLAADEREQLADALWDSVERGDNEASVEKAWKDEITRRCKETGHREFPNGACPSW